MIASLASDVNSHVKMIQLQPKVHLMLTPGSSIRYVGVIQFAFHVKDSDFYQLDLHNKTCVELENLQWSINKNQTSPGSVVVIRSVC